MKKHIPVKKVIKRSSKQTPIHMVDDLPQPNDVPPITRIIDIPLKDLLPKQVKAPRESCVACVRKHVAQAVILLNESQLGYPEHRWLAIGHLSEASEECLGEYPFLAADIRDKRLQFMDGLNPDIMIYLRDDFELLNSELTRQGSQS